MNELQIFNNPDFGDIRTLEENGMVLFCASDVAKALGYARPNDAISQHCRATVKRSTPISGKMQDINFIPESDLYRLVFSSKLPTAETFTDWVTSEVLPTIRKHGAYATPVTIDAIINDPAYGIRLLSALQEEREKSKALTAANSSLTVDNQIMQPKADYFDELVERNTLTNFRETAKQLGVKEKVFIGFLLEKKYIYRDKRGKIMPYADKNTGLFEVKESFNEKTQWSGTQTLVTPKGRETFRLLCQGL